MKTDYEIRPVCSDMLQEVKVEGLIKKFPPARLQGAILGGAFNRTCLVCGERAEIDDYCKNHHK